MNGRIYDPLLGRFLSADLLVQFPGNLQSYNRYAYVRNNPLTTFDPSGFAENTYRCMTEAAEAQYSKGNTVRAGLIVAGQQIFQMASLGTFSKNSEIAGKVGTGQMSVTEGGVRMAANTGIAATALTAAVVTGGAAAPLIGGGEILTATVVGGVSGFSYAAVQTGGDTAIAAVTGAPVPTMSQNAEQILTSTVVGAAGGFLVGGAAAIQNRVASAAPQSGPAPEITPEAPTQTLHRGVNESHVAFGDAANGVVKPNAGSATPLEHNTVPGATLNSSMTSWTTNPAVAENFALRPSGGGVVITAEVPVSQTIPSPNLNSVQLKQSPSVIVPENEVLVSGAVQGTVRRVGQ